MKVATAQESISPAYPGRAPWGTASALRAWQQEALDAYLSMISNRMNEVMKALTLVSTVMLPLTFIAGIYGMNFEHMPELKWVHGYPFALGLMSVVAVAMVWWFRRQRWL